MPGMVLDAMLAGRQPGQMNPADFDRQRRQRSRLQDLVGAMQGRAHPPVATADVRGQFAGRGMPRGWADPHVQQVLEQLLAASGPTRVF